MELVPVTLDHMNLFCDLYIEMNEWHSSSIIMSSYHVEGYATIQDALWRIVLDDTATPVGLVGLQHINGIDRTAEPAIAIVPAHRQQGLGREASKLLVDYAFSITNIRRLQTSVLANAPSRKLLQYNGFQEEGVSKEARWKDGEYVDVVHYGLLKE